MLIESLDPPLDALQILNPRETAFMRHFGWRGDGDSTCVWTPLADITPLLVAAIVKAEDAFFFDHHGIDWRAIRHVLYVLMRTRRVVGGASTITQQLARNLYLTPKRSLKRKLRELWLARRMDRVVSKARVLEVYLNVIEWGPGLWGCVAASDRYFRKTPAELDLFESTFLASLIAAPKAAFAGRNASRSRTLQNWVIHRLFLSGFASGEECAVCIHRVSRLHHLVAGGLPLADALRASADVNAGDDDAVLHKVAVALGLRSLTGAELVPSRCGAEQERNALRRLRAQFGDELLLHVLRTNDYAALRDRVFHLADVGASPTMAPPRR